MTENRERAFGDILLVVLYSKARNGSRPIPPYLGPTAMTNLKRDLGLPWETDLNAAVLSARTNGQLSLGQKYVQGYVAYAKAYYASVNERIQKLRDEYTEVEPWL